MYSKILDVGCGNNKIKGAIGIDISTDTQADIIHDLNRFPWPFNDNEFDEIVCNDVLEHLDNIIAVMEEIHRITKSGGLVKIRVPHFSSSNAYGDISHKHLFSTKSFNCFTGDNLRFQHYTNVRFKIKEVEISFPKLYKGLSFFSNRWAERYERYFAFIFPAGNIHFELQPIK